MCTVIGILNYKGGVAKTTTTVNLGTALWILGAKVLLVDADQQCNLTLNMKFSNPDGSLDTLYEYMRGEAKEMPVYERYDGLDYIPASRNLKDIETFLNPLRNRMYVLKSLLDVLRQHYDYILIDCAPKAGIVNDNVMIASDKIIIPTDCGPFSMAGLDVLKADITEMQSTAWLNPNLELFGMLRTNYEKRLLISRETSKLLENLFPGKVLDVTISRSSRVNEAPTQYMSMFESDPEGVVADNYMRLAEIVMKKKRPQNWKVKAKKQFEKLS